MTDQSVVFDRAADFYDETRGFPPGAEQPAIETLVRAGGLHRESTVLEIGVGTGRITLPTSAHVAACYGIDLAVPMLNRLKSKQQQEPVYVAQGDVTRLPLPAQAFDAVIAVHIFHLIPAWRAALNEVGRVLRPGGLLLSCWNDGPNHPAITALWDAWNTVIPPERRHQIGAEPAQDPRYLEHEGWRQQGETQVCEYTVSFVPQQHIDRLRRRVWSRLWRLTDEELNAGVAAVEAAALAQFGDLATEIQADSSFHVQAYLPPA